MLEQILKSINNWFVAENGVHTGRFSVQDGSISLPFLQNGQYYRVIGSVFNDGVHRYPMEVLNDEEFDGTIWALAIPKTVLDLAADIEAWKRKNGDAAASPYQSESFGGYTYSKGGANGGIVTWQDAFRAALNAWRKL